MTFFCYSYIYGLFIFQITYKQIILNVLIVMFGKHVIGGKF